MGASFVGSLEAPGARCGGGASTVPHTGPWHRSPTEGATE
jgi:hypothetical protein